MARLSDYAITPKGERLVEIGTTLQPEVLEFLTSLLSGTGPEMLTIAPIHLNLLVRYNYVERIGFHEYQERPED